MVFNLLQWAGYSYLNPSNRNHDLAKNPNTFGFHILLTIRDLSTLRAGQNLNQYSKMQFGYVSLRQERRLIAQEQSCWTNQDKQQPDPNWPAFSCVFASLPSPGWPRGGNLPLISSSLITFIIRKYLPLLSSSWKQRLVFQDCKRKEGQTLN